MFQIIKITNVYYFKKWTWEKSIREERKSPQTPEIIIGSLVAQTINNLPAIQEPQVGSLGWEDPLEKEMVVLLPGKFHGRGVWQATVHGVTKESETTEWLTLIIGFLVNIFPNSNSYLSTYMNKETTFIPIVKCCFEVTWLCVCIPKISLMLL